MSEQTFLLIVAVIMSAVFVIVLTFLSAVLWQFVKILREVRGIMANIRLGSDTLTGDLASLRSHIKSFVMGAMSNPFMRPRARRTKPSASSEPNAEGE